MEQEPGNIDAGEVARFAAKADQWWDRHGPYKALHAINPVRIDYIRARAELSAGRVLDVGCGGGLLAEAMAAVGGAVTAIDVAGSCLAVARQHAASSGLKIAYHQSTAEAWVRDHASAYDVVTCMELVEHVPDPSLLVKACGQLVRPGGDIFFATINRTWLARLLVIWIAEYLLSIVPRQTHTYAKFVRPRELIRWGDHAGLGLENLTGLRYNPLVGKAALSRQTAMNYLIHFRKIESRRNDTRRDSPLV